MNMVTFRKAKIDDLMLYFDWANDSMVRQQSFNSTPIELDTHKAWFDSKLNDPNCLMLMFMNQSKENIGQVIFHKSTDKSAIIGVSIEKQYRGKGYAGKAMSSACNYFRGENQHYRIDAYIKVENSNSIKAFESAGFIFVEKLMYQGINSVRYSKF